MTNKEFEIKDGGTKSPVTGKGSYLLGREVYGIRRVIKMYVVTLQGIL